MVWVVAEGQYFCPIPTMEEDKRVTAVASRVNILAAAARATMITGYTGFAPRLDLPLLHKRHETPLRRPVCLPFVRKIGALRTRLVSPEPKIGR